MTRTRPGRLLFAAALTLVVVLQWVAIHRQSLSGDGAYHLITGHQALRYGRNTVNLEHPPLVKLVIAAPLALASTPWLPPLRVDGALAAIETVHEDAERLRWATLWGRYLHLVLFVSPFLWACHRLGGRLAGSVVAGRILVILLGLSLAVLPNLALLQTDVAVSLAFALTLLALVRLAERGGLWRDAVWVGLACGLGLAVKFSAVLLAPAVVVGVVLARRRDPGEFRGSEAEPSQAGSERTRPRASWLVYRTMANLAIIGLVALAVVEIVYAAANWHYDPDVGRDTIHRYATDQGTLVVGDRMRDLEAPLLAVERVDPRLAQWLTGFLGVRTQNALGVYPSYAFGKVRSQGRWWYFPVLLAVKTPLAILLAALAASAALIRARRRSRVPRMAWPAITLVAVYLLTAMTSNYNLGVRHLLPITPLLYLPVAAALARASRAGLVVVTVLAFESIALAPLWMSATNTWWLGTHNPTRFSLGAGNLTYRQNFIVLADVARERGISGLRVIYPPLGDAVVRAYLPDADVVEIGDRLEPGWYAVSVQVEQLVPALLAAPAGAVYGQEALVALARAWLPYWHAVAAGEDHGYVAGTFHLYRLEQPWPADAPPPPSRGGRS